MVKGASPSTSGAFLESNAVLMIELDGTNAGTGFVTGLRSTAAGVTIRGLLITRFSGDGVHSSGITTIDGNIISFNAVEGIRLAGGVNTVTNNTIVDNVSDGVEANGGTNTIGGVDAGNTISRNFAGFNDAGGANNILGNTITGNTTGVRLQVGTNTAGGAIAGQGNIISGNTTDGIEIIGQGSINEIIGNIIDANSGDGIAIKSDDSATAIGGVFIGAGNTISSNGGDGVSVTDGNGSGILSNSISANTGLGIDLAPAGETFNDVGDGDAGPNNLQNFPVLTSAASDSSTTIEGTLNSSDFILFRVEFFSNSACDPSGHGEGENFLGSTDVTTDGSGNAAFMVNFPAAVVLGEFITSTATGPGTNTSEFSQCIEVVLPPFVPTCTLELTLGYSADTLTVAFLVGTNVAVTANVWATSQSDIISLFSGPLPVTEPPINPTITKALPASGTVGLLAALTTPELGIICSEFKTVDTGSPP